MKDKKEKKEKKQKNKSSLRELIKYIRLDYFITSILCVAMGVLFFMFPDDIYMAAGMVIACVMILIGVINIVVYIFKAVENLSPSVAGMAMGVTVIIIGIWIFMRPDSVMMLVPMVIGVIMIAHSARAIRETVVARKLDMESWMWVITLALAILNMALGVICIVDAFGVLELVTVIFGIALIFHGLTNIFTAIYVVATEKKVKKALKNAPPIDVEIVEETPAEESTVEESSSDDTNL